MNGLPRPHGIVKGSLDLVGHVDICACCFMKIVNFRNAIHIVFACYSLMLPVFDCDGYSVNLKAECSR